jgi:threonine synthase
LTPFHYRCTQCGRTFDRDEVRYLCPDCSVDFRPGVPLPGVLEVVFDAEALHRSFNPGRPDWSLLCAVETAFHPPLAVGQTPLHRAHRLGAELGLERLLIKNDALNPSGSLKDRASFLVVAEATRLGERRVVAASTGNAASALACVCASAGLEALIFVPETAPWAKLVQMRVCGARVIPVRGTYDDAFRLSLEYTAQRGGLNRNTAYHPLTIEGKKTAGLEIYAQCGVPEAILVGTGDGVILAGIHKAFVDLRRAGLIDRLPRLVAVQAQTSDAIARYWETGTYADARPTTRADSISVGCPSNAHWARRALQETNGFAVVVSDGEILEAQGRLARTTGVFAEPAAAAALAGLIRIQAGPRPFNQSAPVVLLVTGHGLKDVEAAAIDLPEPIEPVLEAVPRQDGP